MEGAQRQARKNNMKDDLGKKNIHSRPFEYREVHGFRSLKSYISQLFVKPHEKIRS